MGKTYTLEFKDDQDAADFEAGCALVDLTPETLFQKEAGDMIGAKRRNDAEEAARAAQAAIVAPDAKMILVTASDAKADAAAAEAAPAIKP